MAIRTLMFCPATWDFEGNREQEIQSTENRDKHVTLSRLFAGCLNGVVLWYIKTRFWNIGLILTNKLKVVAATTLSRAKRFCNISPVLEE